VHKNFDHVSSKDADPKRRKLQSSDKEENFLDTPKDKHENMFDASLQESGKRHINLDKNPKKERQSPKKER